MGADNADNEMKNRGSSRQRWSKQLESIQFTTKFTEQLIWDLLHYLVNFVVNYSETNCILNFVVNYFGTVRHLQPFSDNLELKLNHQSVLPYFSTAWRATKSLTCWSLGFLNVGVYRSLTGPIRPDGSSGSSRLGPQNQIRVHPPRYIQEVRQADSPEPGRFYQGWLAGSLWLCPFSGWTDSAR